MYDRVPKKKKKSQYKIMCSYPHLYIIYYIYLSFCRKRTRQPWSGHLNATRTDTDDVPCTVESEKLSQSNIGKALKSAKLVKAAKFFKLAQLYALTRM